MLSFVLFRYHYQFNLFAFNCISTFFAYDHATLTDGMSISLLDIFVLVLFLSFINTLTTHQCIEQGSPGEPIRLM